GTLSGTASDQATLSTSALLAGAHTITAAYTSGDANFNSSPPSSAITQTVKIATSTSVTTSPNPSNAGQQVTFTATVPNTSGSGGIPTGSVQSQVDGSNYGSAAALNGSGQASITDSALTAGTHTINAVYTPTGFFGTSTGSTSQTVLAPTTTATVTSNINSS